MDAKMAWDLDVALRSAEDHEDEKTVSFRIEREFIRIKTRYGDASILKEDFAKIMKIAAIHEGARKELISQLTGDLENA